MYEIIEIIPQEEISDEDDFFINPEKTLDFSD